MVVKDINYYVTGNTAEGFVNHLSSNIEGLKETISLEGLSYKESTAILEKLIEENKSKTSIEVLKSPISETYLNGVIFRDKQLSVLGNMEQPFTDKAYELFQKGLEIHDDLEAVYIQEMDFEKADELAQKLHQALLKDIPKQNKKPRVYRRLFGTNTMDGVVNEVPSLIKDLDVVYHVKGRAGTGKSTFMNKIADAACLDHGLDLELYHCSFDPNSIDMVRIPALKTCLFDSTDPHAFQPKDKEKEKVIDIYEEAVAPGTDEKYEKEINELTNSYKSYMKQGVTTLKEEGKEIVKADNEKAFSETKVNQMVKDIQAKLD